MLQVLDQLPQDPGLVGVGYAPELLLHDGLSQDLHPRQVVKRYLSEFAPVNRGGVLPGDCGYLVRDRQDRVEALRTSDSEVVRHLLRGEGPVTRLDLDKRSPRLLTATHPEQAVGI